MSYFDDASLVMIPSGYKDQKVYSVKPLDGSGDLTFTRASNATRVGPDGLIEKVRENNILQSQTFDNASWSVVGGASVAANTTTAPDGTLTADTLTVATTIFSGLAQTFTTSTNSWTISLFVKKGTKDFIYLFDPTTTRYAWFNLTTGALGTSVGAVTPAISSVGNDWYRISVTSSVTGSAGQFFQFGLSDADASLTPASAGTAFIWGAQAEVSDFGPTDYIATTTSAVSVGPVSGLPRLDYLNSSCPRLLLEPQRTNSVLYSEQADNAWWLKYQCTITANQGVSPSGFNDADLFTTSDANAVIYRAGQTAGSLSFFVKAVSLNSGAKFAITVDGVGAAFWNQDGTLASVAGGTATDAVSYGNGWYRCAFNVTSGSVINYGLGDVTGSDRTCLIWGMQNEANASYPSSYLPTLSTSVTRVADAASKTGISSLIGQTEGTIFWDFEVNSLVSTNEGIFYLDNGSGFGNNVWIYKGAATIDGSVYVSGVAQASITKTGITTGRYKCALAYANNNTAFFVNGVQVGTTDTSCTIPAMNRIQMGTTAVSLDTSLTNQALVFKTRLTNAQLAELTTL